MRPHDVYLQAFLLACLDPNVGQTSESRRDAVRRLARRHEVFDDPSRGRHASLNVWRDLHPLAVPSHPQNGSEIERFSYDRHAGNLSPKEEMSESKQDRELIELLNELRVALPGVQVMFAFLLAVPFSQGWAKVTDTQEVGFLVALLTTAFASALLIAPSSFHRIQWRQGDKERLLVISNGLAIAGLGFLAIAMCAVVFTITDYVVGGQFAIWSTVLMGLTFATLWYAIPLYRRSKTDD